MTFFQALEFIAKNYRDFGIRAAKPVPVSGAFHTFLMEPAAKVLAAALKEIDVSDPRVPVFSNLDGHVYTTAEHVAKFLPKQVCKPVKWEQSMAKLFRSYSRAEYAPNAYECGSGRQLSNILRKIQPHARVKSIPA